MQKGSIDYRSEEREMKRPWKSGLRVGLSSEPSAAEDQGQPSPKQPCFFLKVVSGAWNKLTTALPNNHMKTSHQTLQTA